MFGKIRKYFADHKIEILILLVILLVASFLRLYRIADYMTFLGDEGRDAIVAKDILRGDFTLLGPRASAGDFFLGPIYYYMMAPFLLLTNYDPVGPAIMVALFGIATVFLVYYVGKNFFDSKAGLIAASLYAVSPLVVAYSRSSWNPNPMPFFSLLMLFLLYLAVKRKDLKVFALTGFLLGIAMQLHYLTTFVAVIIFFFVLLGGKLVYKKWDFKKIIINYFAIFGGFLIGFSAFLLFEVRHGFPNLRTILNFIIEGNQENTALNYSFLGNIWDVFYRLFARLLTKFPPPEQVNVSESITLQIWQIATIILALAIILFLFRFKDKLVVLLLSLWLILGIVLFGFYSKSIYDYYLGFMFPLPFLLVGNFFSRLSTNRWHKKVGLITSITAVAFLIWFNIQGASFRYPANKQKDQAKTIANFVLDKTGGKPFNFALLTRGNSDHVYRYFFEIANRAPVSIENPTIDPERKSVTDQLLVVCEYQECQPLGNPLWEVAGFGRAEIAGEWGVSFVKVYRLIHYQRANDFSLDKLNLNAHYENSELGITFQYPEEFVMKDETNDPSYKNEKVFLRLSFSTPEVSESAKSLSDFDWKKYSDNTISLKMLVMKNDEGLTLKEYMTKDFQGVGIGGYTPVIQSINEGLKESQIPKVGAFVYEGTGGGEHPKKIYYFSNQNYIYYFSMAAATDTGAQYTSAAETLFDKIVESFEFK
ncbi:MAG: glycosyltransferase family 39 protein [Candidatus Levybacteria bacterium]|nr:glycosyltransferase family 39 protein [Candidatus Levybacteria bacterium]